MDGSDIFERIWAAVLYDPIRELVSDKGLAGTIRARQIGALRQTTPLMMVANIIPATAAAFAFSDTATPVLLGLWVALCYIFAGLNLYQYYKTKRDQKTISFVRSTSAAVKNAFLLGSLWAALPVMFFDSSSPAQMVFLACILGGLMGGGTMGLSVIPAAATTFCLVMGSACMFVLLRPLDPVLAACGVMLGAYSVGIIRLSHESGKRFVTRYIDQHSI